VSSVGPADTGSVLRIPAFRRLWIGLGGSSLGDWLGLLALTAMANSLADGYAAQNYAIAGVLFFRVLPALVMGPLAGYIADRVDRKVTLIWGDYLRGALFLTIPLVGTLWWVFVVTVLVETISLVWGPAKDATVPNLVPRHKLEEANQVSLATTYGTAVPAAALFALLTAVDRIVPGLMGMFDRGAIDVALYLNALSFIASGVVIAFIHQIPRGPADAHGEGNAVAAILHGWSYVVRTPLVRGLVGGMVGAFAAGGVVVGLARTFVSDLGGGDAGYGVLFGAVFTGMALGLWRGPRLLRRVSRRRVFGATLTGCGLVLVPLALVPHLPVVVALAVLVGFLAGAAWVTGLTLLGLEVPDELRGRTFAFVGSAVRLALALVLAVAPLLAGLIGVVEFGPVGESGEPLFSYRGAAVTMLLAALLMTAVGVLAYRQMDDHEGRSLLSDLAQSLPRLRGLVTGGLPGAAGAYAATGCFVALEGGEGAGKSTQSARLKEWLEAEGYEVLLTHEPGDTEIGRQLRRIVLDPATGVMSDRTETLLYAADKAEHVERVVAPALARGAVVVTDRYVDSTLAYQGAGRDLADDEVEQIARWATADLRPHLTVLLDLDPEQGMARFEGLDRIEGESLEFHQRVRRMFLRLAAAAPDHYLVVDARLPADEIERRVRDRVEPLLGQANRAGGTQLMGTLPQDGADDPTQQVRTEEGRA
jgi:dTMP kinase